MQSQHYKWHIRWCKSWYSWRCSQQSNSKYTRKPQIALPNVIEIANESVYGTHLRMLLKIRLKCANECKIESKSEPFSAPTCAHERAKWTMVNAFEVSLMLQFKMHQIIHLELYLKVHFKIYIKMHKKVHLRMH